MYQHIQFSEHDNALLLLDQRLLPLREETVVCRRSEEVIKAIANMTVRGAPAIGVCAAYGSYLAALEVVDDLQNWPEFLEAKLEFLAKARPTAVNLRWAVDRMLQDIKNSPADLNLAALRRDWLQKAKKIHLEDIEINRAIGRYGAELIKDGEAIMTHCNAGALATAGYGTALGVIRAAVEHGKRISVIADETRPLLQGARLTAYELHKEGIPVKVACDNACGLLMARGLVDKIIVGADRIAANGDTANKIGTYTVAVLAGRHNIPFYIAAPISTFDPKTPNGQAIPIEERASEEVNSFSGGRIAPDGVEAFNFAFDVTPASLITGIITERGVLRPPYEKAIAGLQL